MARIKMLDNLLRAKQRARIGIIERQKEIYRMKKRLPLDSKGRKLLRKIESLENEVEALRLIYKALDNSIAG